ncbi:hypothetical protein ABAC460_10225 [Asticcacaulis sp. AC460]|uniref:right-handed parallel beta-helix repeat-containing protein n=1 Tax=Asticcacaulis sp. AC460 TaxID=1282360 RepID=UPI0003C3B934|nr:right-handed parallel beta-helix repeat-containing protein [Asticcacaulis sp. AC460]ESQ90124.1 hypothetical protein ABAC460_10225 [Asticcacaulis sp. AC460]
MTGSRSPLNRNDILHALGAEPLVPLTGGKAKYASYTGGVLRSLEDRTPRLRLELADFPRPEGQSFRLWMQTAVNTLKAMAAGSAATLVVAGSAMATVSEPFGPDMGGTAVSITNCNITIDIEGCALRHTGAKAFEFSGCIGGGLVGNGTLTGPHNTSQYQVRAVDSPGLVFRGVNFSTGNSGIEAYNSPFCKFSDITFREMVAVGIKATRGSIGCEFTNISGRNLAGFLIYGDRWSHRGTVVNPRKWMDESKLTTLLLDEVEYSAAGSDSRGSYAASKYIGEEGVGVTVDNEGWTVTGGEIANVADNGISISAKYCRVSNILLRDNKHDGLHFYGSFNVAVNVTGLNNGKYSQEIDPETGEVVSSTPTNGYCVGVRPNAGACALGNRILGCISIGNRLGDFSDGDAQLYRFWEANKADVPNTAPPGQPSNAVDNVKRYAMYNINGWTTVWTAEGTAVPTAMGGVSPVAYGIDIDAATGLPKNAPSTGDNEGYVRWFDGLKWYYFRSSVKIGKGPWACETSWRGCYGDHPTRNYYQSSFIPAGAGNSFENPAVSVSDAYVYAVEEVVAKAQSGVLTVPAAGLVKLNASVEDGNQTVTAIESPLGVVHQRVILRNGNSRRWTFVHNADTLRMMGGYTVTLGNNDTIEFIQVGAFDDYIWAHVGGSVQGRPAGGRFTGRPIVKNGEFQHWLNTNVAVGTVPTEFVHGFWAARFGGQATLVRAQGSYGRYGFEYQRDEGTNGVGPLYFAAVVDSEDELADLRGRQVVAKYKMTPGANLSDADGAPTCSIFYETVPGALDSDLAPSGAVVIGSGTMVPSGVTGEWMFTTTSILPIDAARVIARSSVTPVGVAGPADKFKVEQFMLAPAGTDADFERQAPENVAQRLGL